MSGPIDPNDLNDIPEADSNAIVRLDRDPSQIAPLDRDGEDGHRSRLPLIAMAMAALLGAVFASLSTEDFVQHLDRQVHAIHCSFIPGAKELGESGCRTALMSAYSSFFRESLWGGLPVSLLAIAVFAYLGYRALSFALRRSLSRRETVFLIPATLLPVLISAGYGLISAFKLEAACRLCIGIYLSSALCLGFALWAHLKADPPNQEDSGIFFTYLWWFVEGGGYVAALIAVYLILAPGTQKTRDGCGTLVKPDDPNGVVVALNPGGPKRPRALEVLDPLCPACKAFDQRLALSGLNERLSVAAILFPLDASCNWMVKETVHPGACAVSEAILCDKENARAILDAAFDAQDAFRAEAKDGDASLRIKLEEKFPKLKGCLGSAAVKAKLNKSLRWVVANGLPVLTPQLFIGQRRVCDEDIDLGLEYSVATMLRQKSGEP